jgi:hypothetical protein
VSVVTVTAPPLRRDPGTHAATRYPIACVASALVLAAEGRPEDAATLHRISLYVAAHPGWPAALCLCAIIPCAETNWTHSGHCCRTCTTHRSLFEHIHGRACAADVHDGGRQ